MPFNVHTKLSAENRRKFMKMNIFERERTKKKTRKQMKWCIYSHESADKETGKRKKYKKKNKRKKYEFSGTKRIPWRGSSGRCTIGFYANALKMYEMWTQFAYSFLFFFTKSCARNLFDSLSLFHRFIFLSFFSWKTRLTSLHTIALHRLMQTKLKFLFVFDFSFITFSFFVRQMMQPIRFKTWRRLCISYTLFTSDKQFLVKLSVSLSANMVHFIPEKCLS